MGSMSMLCVAHSNPYPLVLLCLHALLLLHALAAAAA
jgi:hypothetical protein